MISHGAMRLAMRAKLVTLVVCTTGAVQISATATGYARATGSFLTDGFLVGMELVGSGFPFATNNGAHVITGVDDLTVSCDNCAVDAAAGGRTLTVGLPSKVALENSELNTDNKAPAPGVPYWEEQYIPGPEARGSIGPNARLIATPMFSPRVYVPSNTGAYAADAYADAIKALYPPGLQLPALANGDVLKVRGDVAPFRGQLMQGEPGFCCVPVTIPFRCNNSINSI